MKARDHPGELAGWRRLARRNHIAQINDGHVIGHPHGLACDDHSPKRRPPLSLIKRLGMAVKPGQWTQHRRFRQVEA